MLANEQEPKKKKKGLLSEKMGLDQGSETFTPPTPPAQPGIFPGSAAGELNEQTREEVSTKVQDKLKKRKPNGR